MVDMDARRRVASALLGGDLTSEEWGGFATCPGAHLHATNGSKKDFKVVLEGAPTGYCFHSSCSGEVAEFNQQMRRQIWSVENSGQRGNGMYTSSRYELGRSVATLPVAEKQPKRQPLCMDSVRKVSAPYPSVDREWLRRRSPIDPTTAGFKEFFEALYQPEERVLVFTNFKSQGDFLWWVGHGSYRLAQTQDVSAVCSELPTQAPCGVWFLANPIDGAWHPVRHATEHGRKFSRRAQDSLTTCRYVVLESDTLAEHLWLRVLAGLPGIAAIYTSGSKSIHALYRITDRSKPEWDVFADNITPLMSKLGADPAAISAVRLTRLPFCLRLGSESQGGEYKKWDKPGRQELLWLNPNATTRRLGDYLICRD